MLELALRPIHYHDFSQNGEFRNRAWTAEVLGFQFLKFHSAAEAVPFVQPYGGVFLREDAERLLTDKTTRDGMPTWSTLSRDDFSSYEEGDAAYEATVARLNLKGAQLVTRTETVTEWRSYAPTLLSEEVTHRQYGVLRRRGKARHLAVFDSLTEAMSHANGLLATVDTVVGDSITLLMRDLTVTPWLPIHARGEFFLQRRGATVMNAVTGAVSQYGSREWRFDTPLGAFSYDHTPVLFRGDGTRKYLLRSFDTPEEAIAFAWHQAYGLGKSRIAQEFRVVDRSGKVYLEGLYAAEIREPSARLPLLDRTSTMKLTPEELASLVHKAF